MSSSRPVTRTGLWHNLAAMRLFALRGAGSVTANEADQILDVTDQLMRELRTAPPQTLLGTPVDVDDLLPDADVLRWRFDGGRVVVRPSGTEPKLKAYLEVVEPGGSDEVARQRLRTLRDEVEQLLAR